MALYSCACVLYGARPTGGRGQTPPGLLVCAVFALPPVPGECDEAANYVGGRPGVLARCHSVGSSYSACPHSLPRQPTSRPLETEATSVEQWQVEPMPGLLQTEHYARQVLLGYQQVAPIPPSTVEGRVRARMIAQEALTRDPPLELHVVIDEPVLLRRFGDHWVMYAQLQRLAEAADLPT
jgi:Domain of unknown function (DUF5753)